MSIFQLKRRQSIEMNTFLFVISLIVACDAFSIGVEATAIRIPGDDCLRRCLKIYRPVCGSDGTTYGNSCEFEIAQCLSPNLELELISKGECPDCPSICPLNYSPVCGSDGETYSNRCFLSIRQCLYGDDTLTEVPCVPGDDCLRGCPKIYRPVCGSDGTTYANSCEFEIAQCLSPNLELIREGECPDCPSICPLYYSPVCGSDGKTYSNHCLLSIRQCLYGDDTLTEVPCGQEPQGDECDIKCTEEYDPVCGSDDITYSNRCFFSVAQCLDPSLKLRGRGTCDDIVFYCDSPCFLLHDPRCGSDGRIYDNECFFFNQQFCHDPTLTLGTSCF